jgi:acetyl-CoA carboxylase biotin carboxyl carrier protein
MTDPLTEMRALLMQFEKSGLKDMYVRSNDWTVFMAQPGGAANPMQAAQVLAGPDNLAVSRAPHLGLFEPFCAVGDYVSAGQVIASVDVLGRKTEITSVGAGRVAAVNFVAKDLVEFGEVVAEISAA